MRASSSGSRLSPSTPLALLSTMTAAWSTGGSSTTSGLRTRTRTRSTAAKRSRMPSTTAPASPSSSRRSGPANTSRTRLGEIPVVDGLVEIVARGGIVVHIHPEIHQEALSQPALFLEIAVMPEQHETLQLDGHGCTFPRSTAAATASASTVSRTSCARSIHAPRSNAATAASHRRCRRPLCRRRIAQNLAQRALAREPDDDRTAESLEDVEAAHELQVLIGSLAEADAGIDADSLLGDAAVDRERDPLLEKREHFGHDVVVLRAHLHRPRLAQHVHQADIYAMLGHDGAPSPGLRGAR